MTIPTRTAIGRGFDPPSLALQVWLAGSHYVSHHRRDATHVFRGVAITDRRRLSRAALDRHDRMERRSRQLPLQLLCLGLPAHRAMLRLTPRLKSRHLPQWDVNGPNCRMRSFGHHECFAYLRFLPGEMTERVTCVMRYTRTCLGLLALYRTLRPAQETRP